MFDYFTSFMRALESLIPPNTTQLSAARRAYRLEHYCYEGTDDYHVHLIMPNTPTSYIALGLDSQDFALPPEELADAVAVYVCLNWDECLVELEEG